MARCRGLAHGILEVIVPLVTRRAALVSHGLGKERNLSLKHYHEPARGPRQICHRTRLRKARSLLTI